MRFFGALKANPRHFNGGIQPSTLSIVEKTQVGQLGFALNSKYEVVQRRSVTENLNCVGERRIIIAVGRSIGCNTVDACKFIRGIRHCLHNIT